MKQICFFILLFSTLNAVAVANRLTLRSPDTRIEIAVSLDEEDGTLSYSVSKENTELISVSSLGLITESVDFTTGLSFISSQTLPISEHYELPTGKVREYTNECNELVLMLGKEGHAFHVLFRAYNDGIAYRYYLPGSGSVQVIDERSEVRIPSFDKCWGQKYSHDYSTLYPERDWEATSSINANETERKNEMVSPVLVKSMNGDKHWCLITESANYGDYCASSLMSGTLEEKGRFYFKLYGEVNTKLPLATSWKNVIIGSLPDIVHSTMVENLNPATEMTDLTWIKPGLSAWDWGGEDGNKIYDFKKVKEYIDLAYKMKWPYYTLDDGWAASAYKLQDVVDYADSKGVKLFIWIHQNDLRNDELHVRSVFQNWKNLGFVGTKVDFFDNDSQEMMQKYDKIVRIAGELGLMVNLHGCTKPSGTRRYWPHLITTEAVYGGEQYFFNHLATPAHHNVTLALTRNVIGPMDYTPTEFCRKDGVIRHLTTWSHQLALSVLYESGIQTMSDSHDNYIYNMSRDLLRQLPAAWDETLCLEASPDEYLSLARRSGDDWYLASISEHARTINLPLDFLGEGDYTAQIYKDGNSVTDMRYEEQTVNKSSVLRLDIKATGGATIRISKEPIEQTVFLSYEAEDGSVSPGATIERNKEWCSGKTFVGFLGKGNTLRLENVEVPEAGKYDLTFYYISQDMRDTYVKVNDGEKQIYSFVGNGFTWESNGLALKTVQISLNAGVNVLEFGNDQGDAVNLDRITISPSEDYKNVRIALDALKDGADYGEQAINVQLINESRETLSDVKVSYQINGGALVSEIVPSIAAGKTIPYTFREKADMSAIGVYHIKVTLHPDAARNLVGDRDNMTVSHYPASSEKPISLVSNGGSIHSYSDQTHDGESAWNLIDGNADKKWCDNKTSQPWVIIKLPANYRVNRFVIRDCKTRESDLKNIDQYTISISTKDPKENEWVMVVDAINRRQENIKIDEIEPQEALYVKFETKIPSGDHAVRIYGFDVYGTTTSNNKTVLSSQTRIFPSILTSGEILHINNQESGFLSFYSQGGALLDSQEIAPNARAQVSYPAGIYLISTRIKGNEKVEKIVVK